MTPREFFNLLWQYKPEEMYILLWTWPDKRSHWFQGLDHAGEFAAGAGQTHDVYVGVGLSAEDHGPTRRATSDQVFGITGIGGDLDLQSEAHKKPLPATVAQALTILPTAMPPSILIDTGNGVHPWWLLKEPAIFANDTERKDAARLMLRWHSMLGRNAAARGWSYDRLSDLARILRIPGTLNHKDPKQTKEVKVLWATDRRYNLSDFEEFLDQEGIPDNEAQETAALDWAAQFDNKPLVIDLSRRIPQERIDAWLENDMRFKNTWNRLRHDLKDQSNSGYDLALACFGAETKMSEQDIVTLIIHNRNLHGQGHRTRVDYYQRTIGKAIKATGSAPAIAGGPPDALAAEVARLGEVADAPPTAQPTTGKVAPEGAPVATAGAVAIDTTTPLSEAAKDLLCAGIAKILETPIVRFVKLDGEKPIFHINLAGGRVIPCPGFLKFTSQQFIFGAIGDATTKRIPRFKPSVWIELSNRMLQACFIEEPTDEEDLVGNARLQVLTYIKETGFIANIAEERTHEKRRPFIKADGRITICTSDFVEFQTKTAKQVFTKTMATSWLGSLGAKKTRVRSGPKEDQVRWALPYPEFDSKEIRPQDANNEPAK
jgi:hypothetical protein